MMTMTFLYHHVSGFAYYSINLIPCCFWAPTPLLLTQYIHDIDVITLNYLRFIILVCVFATRFDRTNRRLPREWPIRALTRWLWLWHGWRRVPLQTLVRYSVCEWRQTPCMYCMVAKNNHTSYLSLVIDEYVVVNGRTHFTQKLQLV